MDQVEADVPINEHHVIIVGGGPVGLFCGLTLAQQGINVLVMEVAEDIVQSPRALMYFPIVLHEFEKAGILEEVVSAGYKNREGLTFRTPFGGSNRILAKIPPGKERHGSIDYGVQLGQPRLCAIIRERARQLSNFSIRYGTRFDSLHESADCVRVLASTKDGTNETFSARFVIACDGASSAVRKFLGIPFEGHTWSDWRFLAVNIRYDFGEYGYPAANHVLDPEDWAVIVRASSVEEGLWRIATGIRADIPIEDIDKHLSKKLERLLPGPRPLQYEIEAINPYWAHERAAKTFRAGRTVLCGDAAHVNNPLTALGLTTGLMDVAVLSRLLPKAFSNKDVVRWPQLLDKYAILRRSEFIQKVQKQAIEGKLRIHSEDAQVVAQREDFFNMLNKNPGFGMFVAGTMMERLPDELEPGLWTSVVGRVAKGWETLTIIARIVYWKVRASVL